MTLTFLVHGGGGRGVPDEMSVHRHRTPEQASGKRNQPLGCVQSETDKLLAKTPTGGSFTLSDYKHRKLPLVWPHKKGTDIFQKVLQMFKDEEKATIRWRPVPGNDAVAVDEAWLRAGRYDPTVQGEPRGAGDDHSGGPGTSAPVLIVGDPTVDRLDGGLAQRLAEVVGVLGVRDGVRHSRGAVPPGLWVHIHRHWRLHRRAMLFTIPLVIQGSLAVLLLLSLISVSGAILSIVSTSIVWKVLNPILASSIPKVFHPLIFLEG